MRILSFAPAIAIFMTAMISRPASGFTRHRAKHWTYTDFLQDMMHAPKEIRVENDGEATPPLWGPVDAT